MSRHFDMKLSGWIQDVNQFTQDIKMVELIRTKGARGYLIYNVMRGLICSDGGYYAVLNDGLLTSIHLQMQGTSKGTTDIENVISYFGEIGILDKALLKDKILTSVDIQDNWLYAKKKLRVKINPHLPYWLLDVDFSNPNNDKCTANTNNCTTKAVNCTTKAVNCTTNTTQPEGLVNEKSNIENTTSKSRIDLFNPSDNDVINLIYNEMKDERFDTNKYSIDNIVESKSADALREDATSSAQLELDGFNNFIKKHGNGYLQLIYQACYDNEPASYRDMIINCNIYRAYVNRSSLSELTKLFDIVLKARDIQDVKYYLRGVMINRVIDMKKRELRQKLHGQLDGVLDVDLTDSISTSQTIDPNIVNIEVSRQDIKVARATWNTIVEYLKNTISTVAYEVWFSPLKAVCIRDRQLILSAQLSNTAKSIVRNYYAQIKDAIKSCHLTSIDDITILLQKNINLKKVGE